jgi:hypothetical protein
MRLGEKYGGIEHEHEALLKKRIEIPAQMSIAASLLVGGSVGSETKAMTASRLRLAAVAVEQAYGQRTLSIVIERARPALIRQL